MTREQGRRSLALTLDFFKEHEGRHRSEIDEITVIHASRDKVHLSIAFSRFRADGTRFASLRALWVMARVDGEWRRVSVSNMPLEYLLPEDEVKRLKEARKRLLRVRS